MISSASLSAVRKTADRTFHPHFRRVVETKVTNDFGEATVEQVPAPTILGRLRPLRADEVPGEFATEQRELARLTLKHAATIDRNSHISMGREVSGAFPQIPEWLESARLIVLGDLSSKHEDVRVIRSYLVALQ